MDAATRRMTIWYMLYTRRQIKMKDLARAQNVSLRTIRYDIEQLSLTHPIETVRGRYDGCVRVPDWYVSTANPPTEMQMDFLIDHLKKLKGTEVTMLCSIINALTSL